MVPQRNWEPPVNAHTELCYSSDAGIKVSSHDPLWNYTDMWSSVDTFLETISMLFVEWPSNIYHLCWVKRAYHFHVWSLFFWFLVVTTHTSSLYVLCVKVKPWSFLVLRDNWLVLLLKIDSPAAEMQEFVHSLSYLIQVFPNQVDSSSRRKKRMNNMTKWISTQVHDLLLSNVNSQPLAYRWYWEDLLKVKSSSTS